MNSEPSINPPVRHAAWNIWENPIFRRYCRSRLRPQGLGLALLITVLIAGFITTFIYSLGIRSSMAAADAARMCINPLLFIQGIILFVLGTAQVAGGMTAERDEGVIDYQRLIPMSPLAKVVGYLFGLPVREYVMFLATLPFTAWSMWRGQVAWNVWLPLYLTVMSSALLYHFTGLLTGTVARNRRWAFLLSIGLVFALYTIIPQVAKFGLVFFKYLTIWPVYDECLPGILPSGASGMVRAALRLSPTVKFFNLDFSEVVFTAFSQGGLILTFTVMLCRKWRRTEAHLLGKMWAAGFFVWIQILLLGNALPLIKPGSLFPWPGDYLNQAALLSGVYGLVTLLLMIVLATIITPTANHQLCGWRRARKQGKSALPPLADAATGSWFVLVMAVAGAAGWFLFTRALVESPWVPGHQMPLLVLGYFTAVMVAAGLGYQTLLETRGGHVVGLAVIFVGVVPVMVGTVLAGISPNFASAATWLIGISPASMPFYAAGSLLSIEDLPVQVSRTMPQAFSLWLAVSLVITAWLVASLMAKRKAMAKRILANPTGAAPTQDPP